MHFGNADIVIKLESTADLGLLGCPHGRSLRFRVKIV